MTTSTGLVVGSCSCGGRIRILRSAAANMIPGSFGIHEDVHVDLNARITVDATERYSVYSAFMGPAECGSTGGAEA